MNGKKSYEPPGLCQNEIYKYALLIDTILSNDLPVPVGALFGGTLARVVLNAHQSKTLRQSVRPLKIIHLAPNLVALYIDAGLEGIMNRQKIRPQIIDSTCVCNKTVFIGNFINCETNFGNANLGITVILFEIEQGSR